MKGRQLHWSDTGFSQHLYVQKVDSIPSKQAKGYTKFYKVVTMSGRIIMYLAKGYECAPREVVPFYINGNMNSSFGKNFIEAVKLGIEDAIWNIEKK